MFITKTGVKSHLSGPADFRLSHHLYGAVTMIKTVQNYKKVCGSPNLSIPPRLKQDITEH